MPHPTPHLLILLLLLTPNPTTPTPQTLPQTIHLLDPPNFQTTFTLLLTRGNNCPNTILHSDIALRAPRAFLIRHSNITQDTTPCTTTGALSVVNAVDISTSLNKSALLDEEPTKSVVEGLGDVDGGLRELWVGYESSGSRECGETGGFVNGSVFAFWKRGSAVEGGRLMGVEERLVGGLFYMVVYEKGMESAPCVYVGGDSTAMVTVSPDVESGVSGSPEAGSGGLGVGGGGEGGEVTGSPEGESGVGGEGGADASPSASEEGDGSVCFDREARVVVRGFGEKSMENVNVGDWVLVGEKVSQGGDVEDVYSPVFMFTHRQKDTLHEFVRISTQAGQVISLTSGHYLYVDGRLAAARTVKEGSIVQVRNGKSTRVLKVDRHTARGLYNPQTLHGDIIVNGVRASTYTTTVNPSFAHGILAPFRSLYRLLQRDPSMGLFDKGADSMAKWAPRGESVY